MLHKNKACLEGVAGGGGGAGLRDQLEPPLQPLPPLLELDPGQDPAREELLGRKLDRLEAQAQSGLGRQLLLDLSVEVVQLAVPENTTEYYLGSHTKKPCLNVK